MADTTGPTRRSMVGPALLALIFLAIIGASVGSILATRDGGQRGDARPTSPGSSSSGGTPTAPATPTGSPTAGTPCPAVTEQAAVDASGPDEEESVLESAG